MQFLGWTCKTVIQVLFSWLLSTLINVLVNKVVLIHKTDETSYSALPSEYSVNR